MCFPASPLHRLCRNINKWSSECGCRYYANIGVHSQDTCCFVVIDPCSRFTLYRLPRHSRRINVLNVTHLRLEGEMNQYKIFYVSINVTYDGLKIRHKLSLKNESLLCNNKLIQIKIESLKRFWPSLYSTFYIIPPPN